jgi:hypothetical protein
MKKFSRQSPAEQMSPRARAEQMRKYLLSGGRVFGPGVVRIADYKARKARQAIWESVELALNTRPTPSPAPTSIIGKNPT